MRQINVHLNDGDELIRLYATRGRRYWYALIERDNGTFRMVSENGACSYTQIVDRLGAIGDVESRIAMAKRLDDITYRPIEASSNIEGTR